MLCMKRIASIAILLLLVGCQATGRAPAEPLLHEHYRQGGQLTLNQPVTIPVQRARTYLQGGAEIGEKQVARLEPICELEVRTLRDTPVTVKPDIFSVVRVRLNEDGSEGFSSSFSFGFGEALIKYVTELRLQSPRQPDVLQLVCSHHEYASRGHYMSVSQFQQAVGKYLSIR